MTNFEKWKESLAPEMLLRPRLDGKTRCVWIDCATNCPAENCPAKRCWIGRKVDLERWRKFGERCDKWFLRWATAPAKEEK